MTLSAVLAPQRRPGRSTTPSPSPPDGAVATDRRRSPRAAPCRDRRHRRRRRRDRPRRATGRTPSSPARPASGKSELLRTLVAALRRRRAVPTHLTFVLVDYKGGSTFDACADLPHTVGVVTDLDDRLAERALVSLEAELRRRERLLRAAGADDLAAYHSAPARRAAAAPRRRHRRVRRARRRAARRSCRRSSASPSAAAASASTSCWPRSDRPASSATTSGPTPTCASPCGCRTAPTPSTSSATPTPPAFPRATPGRAMLRLGPARRSCSRPRTARAPYRPIGDGSLHVRRRPTSVEPHRGRRPARDRRTTERAGGARPIDPRRRRRCARSPRRSDRGSRRCPNGSPPTGVVALGDGVVGLVDDPAGQRQAPLRWVPGDGNLALIGALGIGHDDGAALAPRRRAAGERARATSSTPVATAGSPTSARLPTCGGVVGCPRRGAARPSRPPRRRRTGVVASVAVDAASADHPRRSTGSARSWPPLSAPADGRRTRPSAPHRHRGRRRRHPHRRHGRAARRRSPTPRSRRCAERWLFHLDDPAECAALGVRAGAVPAGDPGPARRRRRRLEAQLAVLPVPAGVRPSAPSERPPAIGALAAEVDAASLPASIHQRRRSRRCRSASTSPRSARRRSTCPTASTSSSLGPARSGRSTALVRLAAAWRERPRRRRRRGPRPAAGLPGAVVGRGVAGGGSPLRTRRRSSRRSNRSLPATASCVVVDDAERVDRRRRPAARPRRRARHVACW